MANQKAKYWWAVLYPESMVSDWEQSLSDVVQVPFAYCIHNKDNLDINESIERKTHVHLILAFPNTTTYNHALSVFQELQSNCLICKRIINIRQAYEYLIHNTDECKKKGKFQYKDSERITGNNFDIGAYQQLGVEEKHKMLDELIKFIINNGYTNMIDFVTDMYVTFPEEYKELIYGYHGLLECFCKGNYLKSKS